MVGGGVAGIASAIALAGAGAEVTLMEKRPLLGGRASSWIDHETGQRLDACQHGTMRCCTNLADLLERLGVTDQIRYHDVLHFLDSDGKRSQIRGCGLPAPLHTSLSFLAFKSLGLADKACIARALIKMLRTKPGPELDLQSVGDWFTANGQTERAVKRFFEPILVSACNESLDRISCHHAFKIFREGFLTHPTAFHFGVPRVPLATLYTEPTVEFLGKRGGSVRLKTTVDKLNLVPGELGVTLQNGEKLQFDALVSALQFDLLLKMLPQQTVDLTYFRNLQDIDLSPIVGVHICFDRHIDCPECVALLDRRTDWIFNKNINFDKPTDEPTYLSMVASADHELAEMPREEVFALTLREVHEALPATRDAKVVRWHVLKERKATFSPKPGIEALRPQQKSPVAGLYVAGEWTDTGWPSTMEGAARSGYLAAEALLRDRGIEATFLAPELPVRGLARWLTRKALEARRKALREVEHASSCTIDGSAEWTVLQSRPANPQSFRRLKFE